MVVRDDQTHRLKLSSPKTVLCEIDFLGLAKFYPNSKIIHKYIFAEIRFKIFETSYPMHILVTTIYLKYLFIWSDQVQLLIINSMASFSKVKRIDRGHFLHYSCHDYVYCIISSLLRFLGFREFKKSSRCTLVNQALLLIQSLNQVEILAKDYKNHVSYWIKISL